MQVFEYRFAFLFPDGSGPREIVWSGFYQIPAKNRAEAEKFLWDSINDVAFAKAQK